MNTDGHRLSLAGALLRWLVVLSALLAASACATPQAPRCLGDCVNGRGTLILESGEQYVGEFKNGLRHGYGTLTLTSGEHYSGEWQYGVRHGRGTWVWPNGDKFVGEWRNGQKHGEGTLFFSGGTLETGRWEHGKPVETEIYKADPQTETGFRPAPL